MSTHHNEPASQSHGGNGHRIGSVLAIILTVIPFWLVMSGPTLSPAWTAAIIFAFAIVQIIVHVAFFLHLDTRSEGGWTLLSFLFTAVIVILTIGGSIWVMYHLNTNMMPMPTEMGGGH